MTVRVGDGTLRLEEVHRFGNEPVRVLGTLHWDILRLYADVLDGLRSAARAADLASIGIDSWGVDYGLLGPGGVLLGNPVHYRDTRTDGVAAEVAGRIGAAELYAVTGIQQLPFNGSRRAGPHEKFSRDSSAQQRGLGALAGQAGLSFVASSTHRNSSPK